MVERRVTAYRILLCGIECELIHAVDEGE